MTNYTNTHYWLAATHLKNLGPITIRRALDHFTDIKNLFHASANELQNIGFTPQAVQTIQSVNLSAEDAIIKWCERTACQIITLDDQAYPPLLKEINDAPLVLYVRGNVINLSQPQIAIVGTRNPTHSGRECAEAFAATLAQAGLIVTSGLAQGIDGASHLGALSVSMPTIAVLGHGFAHIYPPVHTNLAKRIAEVGTLVSEFPPTIMPYAKNFPRRNRIISGLSLGVIIIEATLRSGSLITARFAVEQGREVFAIPGSIHNPQARGCHYLIRQGAKLVETAADILEELNELHQAMLPATLKNNSTKPPILDKKHQEMLSYVGYEATSVETLMARSGLTVTEVSSMLLSLELQNYVNFTSGGYVRYSANSR